MNASGGGIYTGVGGLRIISSHVDGNIATAVGTSASTSATAVGGGIEMSSITTLTIAGSTLSANRAVSMLAGGNAVAEGGAINGFTEGGSIRNTVLNANHARATSSGGATVPGDRRRDVPGDVEPPHHPGLARHEREGRRDDGRERDGGRRRALARGRAVHGSGARSSPGTRWTRTRTGASSSAVAGGLHVRSTAVVGLVESTVRANRADSTGPLASSTGGGVAVSFSTLNVRASTLNANVAADERAGARRRDLRERRRAAHDLELDPRREPGQRRDRARRRHRHGHDADRHERRRSPGTAGRSAAGSTSRAARPRSRPRSSG